MKLEQVSINLYTLREHLQTRDAFTASMKRLAEIGYRTVQLSGVPEGVLSPEEFVSVCADHGLRIIATHEPSAQVLDEPQRCIDRLRRMGITQTSYPFPAGVDFGDAAQVDAWLHKLAASRRVFAEAGITLSYHNHAHEFSRLDGTLLIDLIASRTGMAFELDTYWVAAGGVDPVKWVRRMAGEGRLPVIHLKDMRITPKGEQQFAELGGGNLDLPAIIEAAESGGCNYFIVEQDRTWGRDMFDNAADSFRYLQQFVK